MKTALKNLSLSTLLLLGTLSPSMPAQGKVVCFSIEGTTNTSGANNTSGASQVGVTVGGQTTLVTPGAGKSPTQVRDQLHDALKAKGYTVGKVGGNVVCVSAGPGGKALTSGGGIGSDDTGLGGIDAEVMKPPPVKEDKPAGGAVPGAKPEAPPARTPGTITIEIEIEINGQRQKIKVTITINQGETSQTINPKIKHALQSQGLLVNDISWRPVVGGLTTQPISGFGIDRTVSGYPVVHVIQTRNMVPLELIPMELTAGEFPLFGATSFGEGCSPLGRKPFVHMGNLPPKIDSFFDIFADLTPANTPGGFLVGPGRTSLPLDLLCPGATLLVDPASSVFFPMAANQNGQMRFPVTLPPNPSWVGLTLYWQAAALVSPTQLAVSDALATTIGR